MIITEKQKGTARRPFSTKKFFDKMKYREALSVGFADSSPGGRAKLGIRLLSGKPSF